MSVENRVTVLKSEIEEAKKTKIKVETELEAAQKVLKEKYGVTTIEEVEELIASKQSQLDKLQAQQVELLDEADALLRTGAV